MKQNDFILAIDTSCDDTSAAVTSGTTILSNVIASQTQLHKEYGGVFPTVAKQAHKENIDAVVAVALKRAHITIADISAIAVTQGPGLAPALEVGINKARELAAEYNKPLIAVNHLEGHLLSVLAEPQTTLSLGKRDAKQSLAVRFPVLGLVVSGGNTLFVLVHAVGEYEVLGSTVDDAAGECLDKIGRMLGLGYPAGPVIEQFAKLGNHRTYEFPLPMTTSKDFNLSFSGLKTSARNLIAKLTVEQPLTQQQTYDFCASIQYAVFRHIINKMEKILQQYDIKQVWLGGGVAANMALRATIRATLHKYKHLGRDAHLKLYVPYTKKLTVDNAAMIGVAASYKLTRAMFVESLEELQRISKLKLSDTI